jgi:positive regulator of sigma E activity
METIPALVYQIPVPPSCMEPVGFARWTCPSDQDSRPVGTRSSVLEVFKIESRKGTHGRHFFADNCSQTLQCNNTLLSFQLLCFLLSAVLLYLVCLINFHGILLITLLCTALQYTGIYRILFAAVQTYIYTYIIYTLQETQNKRSEIESSSMEVP